MLLVFLSLFSMLFPLNSQLSIQKNDALLSIRLSRLLTAIAAGIALSASGVVFHSVFRNRMADPYLLGASSGASFMVSLAYFLFGGAGTFIYRFVPAAGFLGSAAATTLTFILGKKGRRFPIYRLLLTGIAVSFLFGSITPILMAFSGKDLYSVFFFMNGTTQGRSVSESLYFLILTAPALILLVYFSSLIDYLLLGEERGYHIGIDIETAKIILLSISSYMTGISVAFAGIVGFVGLIIPNICRKELMRSPLSWLIISALTGSVFLVASDFVARNLFFPREIPLTSVTALIGAPYLIWALRNDE
jgi:iron complex transport system permease protein